MGLTIRHAMTWSKLIYSHEAEDRYLLVAGLLFFAPVTLVFYFIVYRGLRRLWVARAKPSVLGDWKWIGDIDPKNAIVLFQRNP